MSRASWKFLPFLKKDVWLYIITILNGAGKHIWMPKRNQTVNNLNRHQYIRLHNGFLKTLSFAFKPCIFHKFGELTKTRKPFFFRSKKKS